MANKVILAISFDFNLNGNLKSFSPFSNSILDTFLQSFNSSYLPVCVIRQVLKNFTIIICYLHFFL